MQWASAKHCVILRSMPLVSCLAGRGRRPTQAACLALTGCIGPWKDFQFGPARRRLCSHSPIVGARALSQCLWGGQPLKIFIVPKSRAVWGAGKSSGWPCVASLPLVLYASWHSEAWQTPAWCSGLGFAYSAWGCSAAGGFRRGAAMPSLLLPPWLAGWLADCVPCAARSCEQSATASGRVHGLARIAPARGSGSPAGAPGGGVASSRGGGVSSRCRPCSAEVLAAACSR